MSKKKKKNRLILVRSTVIIKANMITEHNKHDDTEMHINKHDAYCVLQLCLVQ